MLPGTSISFIFTLKHLRSAEAIFILYSYCKNDVIACCFTSKQHHNSAACMRDLACNRGPARLLSVQVNQTQACMLRSASIQSFTVDVICATLVLWSCSKCCLSRLSDLLIFLLTFSFCSGIKSENFLTLLFRHVLLWVSNVDWIFKLLELYVCVRVWFLPVFIVVDC